MPKTDENFIRKFNQIILSKCIKLFKITWIFSKIFRVLFEVQKTPFRYYIAKNLNVHKMTWKFCYVFHANSLKFLPSIYVSKLLKRQRKTGKRLESGYLWLT